MVEDVSGGYDQGSQWRWWVLLRVPVVVMINGVSGSVCGYDLDSFCGYDHLIIFHDIEMKKIIIQKYMEMLHRPQCT